VKNAAEYSSGGKAPKSTASGGSRIVGTPGRKPNTSPQHEQDRVCDPKTGCHGHQRRERDQQPDQRRKIPARELTTGSLRGCNRASPLSAQVTGVVTGTLGW